jgi:hypothetical protein
MCEHLEPLDQELKQRRIKETFRGQPWSNNCREWAYYDCLLDLESLQRRFNFASCVQVSVNDDSKSGLESGFYCESCKDGIMGAHPSVAQGKVKIS